MGIWVSIDNAVDAKFDERRGASTLHSTLFVK